MHDFSRFRNHTSFTQVFRDQNPRKIQVLQRKKKVVQLKFCVVLAYFHDCFVHFKSYYVPFGSLQRSPIGPQSSGWRTTELSVICIKILHNQYKICDIIYSFIYENHYREDQGYSCNADIVQHLLFVPFFAEFFGWSAAKMGYQVKWTK